MSGRGPARVERRNATFQQWQALLTNRTKRTRAGEMVVQGVRPITLAVEHGFEVRTLLVDGRPRRSDWARDLIRRAGAPVVTVAPELMAELGERESGPPEVLAIVALPGDDLGRLPVGGADDVDDAPLIVAFDRPASPGNIGSLARSADALGGAALVTTGHSADAWDPASIRASTGSIFALPVLRLASAEPLLAWVEDRRAAGVPFTVVGTDEGGDVDLPDAPLTGPTVLVVGSEATGMSAGWRDACDMIATIPMTGSASSLNAANAGTVALYEAVRQRRRRR